MITFQPSTPVDDAISDCTITDGTDLATLNMRTESSEETKVYGKGHMKGKGKKDSTCCTGRPTVTAKIFEKPVDKDDQVGPHDSAFLFT